MIQHTWAWISEGTSRFERGAAGKFVAITCDDVNDTQAFAKPEVGIAIPIAAGTLYAWGFILSPAVGAILMSLSTEIVAVNARFLKLDK